MELHQKISCSAISRLKWLRTADMVYTHRDSPMVTPMILKWKCQFQISAAVLTIPTKIFLSISQHLRSDPKLLPKITPQFLLFTSFLNNHLIFSDYMTLDSESLAKWW